MAESNARGGGCQAARGGEMTMALEGLKETRALPVPRRIEGFDIAHLEGTDTVGSMVRFTMQAGTGNFTAQSRSGAGTEGGRLLIDTRGGCPPLYAGGE